MTLETYALYVTPCIMLGIGAAALTIQRVMIWRRRAAGRRALVLAVIRDQQPNGTGYTLTTEVHRREGSRSRLAEIYSHLAALQRVGAVSSRWGEADRPGGPRPRHYWITADHPELTHEKWSVTPRRCRRKDSMPDSLGMKISKLVIQEEPQLLVNDMGANARACLALTEVLGSLLATLKATKGQAYYQTAVRAILERVDETAKSVHQRAEHMAENEPEMRGPQ